MYNILVCDDERDIVSALRIYLESEGYRVIAAYGGQEALDTVRRQDIQLILLDIMERFVRGDSSRSTEGSGLGLSIAQSLTQLQKGEFRIVIDGDLFKALVSFDALPLPS